MKAYARLQQAFTGSGGRSGTESGEERAERGERLGAITYDDRANGIIIYALTANDTVIANAGNWEGEVELKNSAGTMIEQTQSFNFTIEESY